MSEIILSGAFAFLLIGAGSVALAIAYGIYKDTRK